MTPLTLLRANLFRKPARTGLTIVSLAIAFLLFMMLRAIAAAFTGGIVPEGLDRLVVDSRYSLTDNLPIAWAHQIRDMDLVAEVAHLTWFSGYYQHPKNSFSKYPVEPGAYFDVMRTQLIEPDVLERFVSTRVGAVVSEGLAQQYGWQAGDVINIRSDTYPQADGNPNWRFEMVGTFSYARGEPAQPLMLFHHDYYNQSVAEWARDVVGWLVVRVRDPQRLSEAVTAIDTAFANSPYPTRSTPEDEYRRQFAAQLGDIGSVTSLILGAVFFTIVLLTANTAVQAFKDRIPDLAVMKTLGFGNVLVAMLVFGEAVIVCLVGAAVGIALAYALEPTMNANLGGFTGSFAMSGSTAVTALVMAVLLGSGIGAYTAWAAGRLSIVDALNREH